MTIDVEDLAAKTLEQLESAGFDSAQVSVGVEEADELSVIHNQPSLLRSTERHEMSIVGIVDGRKADAGLTDLRADAISQGIGELYERARLAPQDEANAVSSSQSALVTKGPMAADMALLAKKMEELMSFREAETPTMALEEAAAIHTASRGRLVTSDGTSLSSELGYYTLHAMGTATEGDRSSSFNHAGGRSHDLSVAPAPELFGIGEMLEETTRQIDTESFDGNFVGDVLLAPQAVGDLIGWLVGQLSDFALIQDASVYKERVGETIAAEGLTVRSRFDGPGMAGFTGDGFVASPLTLIDSGRLTTLLPSLYGSRKTGLPHRPAGAGWVIDPGTPGKEDIIAGIDKGALVGRLSMGSPAPNGDFSGVIKNSFKIERGELGRALSETMVAGNMATMLKDIVEVSKEHLDVGSTDFPWIRVAGLNFS